MSDVVQVVTTVGDTVIDCAFVAGVYELAWVDARIDGFVAHIGGERHAITTAPGRTRVGVADVWLVRVPRPQRSVPRPPAADRRVLGYLVASLAVHLSLWSIASDKAALTGPLAQS